MALSRVEKEQLHALLREQERRIRYNQLDFYKPQAKQIEYHNATEPDVCLGAGNQLGKTFAASRDIAYHMTGLYPDWWEGDRFEKPPKLWICGRTTEVVRDSIQTLVLGGWENDELKGSGAIPRSLIIDIVNRTGLRGAVDTFLVKHVTGGLSRATFKSYDMGREKFQAATLDKVYFDEEPPQDIYSEGRTRTNKGQLGNKTSLTFTPLLGMTTVVKSFFQDRAPHQRLVQFTIHDAEHYTDEEKKAIIDSYPEDEREARANGIPILGSGRIFPVKESDIKEAHISNSEIPRHWRLINGVDFGWDHPQALCQIGYDADNDVIHVLRGKRIRKATPIEAAAAIRGWVKNVPTAWPHDGYQHDKGSGKSLASQYREAGFRMLGDHATHAEGGNGVEAGVTEMLERMRTGRLKVDESITEFFEEMRIYHRKDGRIVKLDDDLISAVRYAIMMIRFSESVSSIEHENQDLELNFMTDFG